MADAKDAEATPTPDPEPAAAESDAPASGDATASPVALLDFGFNTFLTTRIIKVVYALMLIGSVLFLGLGMLGSLLMMVQVSFLNGFVGLIITPIATVMMLLSGRMYLELVIVIFRISEDISTIAGRS